MLMHIPMRSIATASESHILAGRTPVSMPRPLDGRRKNASTRLQPPDQARHPTPIPFGIATNRDAIAHFFVAQFFSPGHTLPVHAKSEELLYHLMFAAEIMLRPTFRNLNESFEGWAYRTGVLRQLQRLECQQLIEKQPDSPKDRLFRLTESGRLHALGGRDPEARWRRPWDGIWRLILYDVPEARRATRNKLRHYLRNHRFGYLQNSVWVTPDHFSEERAVLADGPVNVESLILFEARPSAGETDADIVTGAWNWKAIDQRYTRYREILSQRPSGQLNSAKAARIFQRWLGEERKAWIDAVGKDPLLPAALLPADYSGRRAWQLRLETIEEAGGQMRRFQSPRRG